MSISDQAFIRAYHEDAAHRGSGSIAAIDVGLGSVVPPPHAKFRPVGADTATAGVASQVAGEHSAQAGPWKSVAVGSTAAHTSAPQIGLGTSPKASLSSFAGLAQGAAFAGDLHKPALEVDAVRWPAVCETLLTKWPERFDRLAAEIRRDAAEGQKVIAITGAVRGEGRTTLALCLARRLAAQNAKVALVDADFLNPVLASQLGVSVERGWEAALDGEEAVWEVMIESVADRLAMAPLHAGRAGQIGVPAAFRIAAILGELAERYELVLVDAGPLATHTSDTHWLLESAVGVQGVVVAHDVRHAQAQRLAACCLQLADAKLRQLGIAEMFVLEK